MSREIQCDKMNTEIHLQYENHQINSSFIVMETF